MSLLFSQNTLQNIIYSYIKVIVGLIDRFNDLLKYKTDCYNDKIQNIVT